MVARIPTRCTRIAVVDRAEFHLAEPQRHYVVRTIDDNDVEIRFVAGGSVRGEGAV